MLPDTVFARLCRTWHGLLTQRGKIKNMNIAFTRLNIKKKPMHRVLILQLFDTASVICAFLLVFAAHFFDQGSISGTRMLLELMLTATIYCVISMFLGVNRIVWRYAESYEYLYLIGILLLSGMLSGIVCAVVLGRVLGAVYYAFAVFFCAAAVTFSRVVYQSIMRKRCRDNDPRSKRLIIIGAGSAGVRLLEEIYQTPSCGLVPCGFIDDSDQKQRRSVAGCRVLGKVKDIGDICREHSVNCIYIAIPSLTNEERSQILDECLKTGCEVKILPRLTELAGRDNLTKVRSIDPEELLGRDPVSLTDDGMLDFLTGRVVAITGGGGSIGSELCRRIAAHSPKKLIIIDVYENNAYAIQQELIAKYPKLDLEVCIATVCDRMKIKRIFREKKPELVIHAAAHKHVPLMETVPDEAVKNNIFGTINTCIAARDAGVEKFILISTDKAVNPTNVMGATKRVCEMIIQCMDRSSPDTSFAAVRFGNVLGSNGSVIPLFKSQIEERRDVTVTDPNMIRYFMTISEASQLVLTASAMAKGGEIFVLDMGEPVKIDDLARNMIRLSGLELGRDINIKYIGLRPGEKLYEELLMNEEGLRRTPNRKIFIGNPIDMNNDQFEHELSELREIVDRSDASTAEVIEKLRQIVPTFTHRSPIADTEAVNV